MTGGASFREVGLTRGEALAVQDRILLAPIDAPAILDSSPHMVSIGWLRSHLAWSPARATLLNGFNAQLDHMRREGIEPICALLGGSFAGEGDAPRDIDALVVYRTALEPAAIATALQPRISGLDLRYVPEDAGPELLIKMVCFFHALYQGLDKGPPRASLLISLINDLPPARNN